MYVSNSFVTPEALELLAGRIDVLCSDIKSINNAFYREICGKAKVWDVLRSIERALGIHVETRTNVIPGRNDNLIQIAATACWIRRHLGADSPWHLTRFFPTYKLSHIDPTPPETLDATRQIAMDQGLRNVYVYKDQDYDCARETLSVEDYLGNPERLYQEKKYAKPCCGGAGILLKKFEKKTVEEPVLAPQAVA